MSESTPDTNRGNRDVPRVIVAQHVVDKIVRGALLYPDPETGEAMVGLIFPRESRAEPDIYILETISPGERAVREWGMFEQGDDWQADVFNWWYANWETYREMRRGSYGTAQAAKWDVPLVHVGDWHKQPGDMVEPSSGDAQTARRMIADAETPIQQLVAPIVTMYPLDEKPLEQQAPSPSEASAAETSDEATPLTPETEAAEGTAAPEAEEAAEEAAPEPTHKPVPEPPKRALLVPVTDQGWLVRIDFWYMSRHIKRFVPVVPEVVPDDSLPTLPALAWHLAKPHRFDQEYKLLLGDGYVIDIVRWDADGKPPYEICFSLYRRDTNRVILLITSADYPAEKPSVRVAPLVNVADDEDVFEKLYAASRPLTLLEQPDWDWDSKRTLVELARHVEEKLKDKDKAI
ncbi:MAG: hypothetical protein GXY36_15125 [Chloroflexi bacterium]|nr:hypothetical protein [Chloroflexota bacterium]